MKLRLVPEAVSSPLTQPIGAAVMDLRGSTSRLQRALDTGTLQDILISRAHLSEAVERYRASSTNPPGKPEVIAIWLSIGSVSLHAADAMLSEATAVLTGSLRPIRLPTPQSG